MLRHSVPKVRCDGRHTHSLAAAAAAAAAAAVLACPALLALCGARGHLLNVACSLLLLLVTHASRRSNSLLTGCIEALKRALLESLAGWVVG
jgi:hypothetical protein